MYLRFLADQEAHYKQVATDLWLNGQLDAHGPDELRGRTLALGELCNLTYLSMAEFYLSEANADSSHE